MHPMEGFFYVTTKIMVTGSFGLEVKATGFVFQYRLEEGFFLFLVTNKHVVENLKTAGFRNIVVAFHEKETLKDGSHSPMPNEVRYEIENFVEEAILHDDEDIAIFPLNDLIDDQYYKMVSTDIIPTQEVWMQLNPLEDLLFIGYPDGLYDTFNNLPIRRTGVTSTPLRQNYKGKEQILVEASIFQGSSGSPVFIYKPSMSSDMDGIPHVGPRIYFIGVISELLQTVGQTRENLHLGVVTRFKAITDLIKEKTEQDFHRMPDSPPADDGTLTLRN